MGVPGQAVEQLAPLQQVPPLEAQQRLNADFDVCSGKQGEFDSCDSTNFSRAGSLDA